MRLWAAAAAGGVIMTLVGGAARSPRLELGGYVLLGLAIAPILAIFVIVVAFVAAAVVAGAVKRRAFRRALRAIDQLDARCASDEEYDRAFAKLAPPALGLLLWTVFEVDEAKGRALAARLLAESCPSRRWYLPLVYDLRVLEEIALRPADPVAPTAWLRALRLRHGNAVREDVPARDLVPLWVRATLSGDPFNLPPELLTKVTPKPFEPVEEPYRFHRTNGEVFTPARDRYLEVQEGHWESNAVEIDVK